MFRVVNHQRELTQKHKEREEREEEARKREVKRRNAEREIRGRNDLDLSLVIPDTFETAHGTRRTHRSTARYGDLADLPGLIALVSVAELEKRARAIFHESKRVRDEEMPGLYRLTDEWMEREEEEARRRKQARLAASEMTESEEEEAGEESEEEEEEGMETESDSSTDSEIEEENENETEEEEEEEEEEAAWKIESTVEKPQVKMEEFDGWVVDVEDEERTESEKISDFSV